ncbi:hypothetical protein C8R44DRAFT_832633 [Mycena epipterygia]|nr:hypothetical protein C8R44DRAFT_832633 [Mycena epipterygia]
MPIVWPWDCKNLADTLYPPSLPAPAADQPYMHISAMQAGIIKLPVYLIIQGESRTYTCPSLSFYLKHSASGRHFIFDLGLRHNFDSYPPEVIAKYSNLMPTEVPKSVAESCVKGGLDPAAIERVVISHLHFDHIGDCTPFTTASLILGGGYPSTAFRRPIAEALCGHITLLARMSSDGSWMYLGGDVAHDTRLITDPKKTIVTTAESETPYCMHSDPAQASLDISRVRALVKFLRVEFIVAHDWKWYEDILRHAFLPGRIVPKS